ncbi:regulatory protein YcgZ [Pantoea ananatis]|uniref:regulatory protein YcgZ n=1 Tax=Pantoea TaxID=53335 RepID=UPI0020CA8075|nr:regulatory protein YcgZ [Pantoea ananatis]MCW0314694.1 putative two-component-system connector protein YcgZ [Pantoea ananatis]MCW1833747.1 regulatory protein YcgZ [Pantoea ananatis]
MQYKLPVTGVSQDVSSYFSRASLPSQQETLGAVVVEILRAGRSLNRKAICKQLIVRMSNASSPQQEEHLQELLRLLF